MKTITEVRHHSPCSICKSLFESCISALKGFVSPLLLIKTKNLNLRMKSRSAWLEATLLTSVGSWAIESFEKKQESGYKSSHKLQKLLKQQSSWFLMHVLLTDRSWVQSYRHRRFTLSQSFHQRQTSLKRHREQKPPAHTKPKPHSKVTAWTALQPVHLKNEQGRQKNRQLYKRIYSKSYDKTY